ncbi:MAG TPA: histidine kinase dimerization/phospho-acceptor domain-containing protein, partial [Bacteroidales bacterium]
MKTSFKIFFLIIIIFFSFSGNADDLNKSYYNKQTQNDDTTRVQELINLANECRYYFPESQAGYAREALEISQKTNYSLGEGLALKGLGKYFFEQGNYDSSYYYYTKAKLVFSNLGNNKELSNVIGDYCFLCINKGEYNKALEAGLTVLQIAQEMKDEEELQYTYAYLGYTYYSLKNYDEAKYYLNLGLKLAENNSDNKAIARILTYMALVCEKEDNNSEAVQNYLDAADLLTKEGDEHSLGIAYFNRGEAFRCQKKYDNALVEYLSSYKIVNQLNDQDGKNLLLLRIAKVYIEILQNGNNISAAKRVVREVGFTSIDVLLSTTCDKLTLSNNKDNMMHCLQLLISLKKSQRHFNAAFELNNQLIALKDTLAEMNKANILADLLIKYELEKNNEQIELLSLINKTNEEKINNQKILFIFFGIAVLMLITVLFALRNRIKTIARTKDEIDKINSKLEAEKHRAEQSEQFKEQFLANVSHEIRTPLNAIMGITNILIKNEHMDSQEVYLEAMRISSKNLLGLINDILNLSKFEAGKVEIENKPFIINEILASVIGSVKERASQKGNKLELTIDNSVPKAVVGDDSMLHHILLTLVRNGNSFTEGG